VDALTFLRQDHDRVLAMLDELEQVLEASQGDARALGPHKALVRSLLVVESEHEALEDRYFWPVVRAHVTDGEALAARAATQEAEARSLRARIDRAVDPAHVELATLVANVVREGRTHIAYEQDEVWPRVREALDADALGELGAAMAKAKVAVPPRPDGRIRTRSRLPETAGTGLVDRARDVLTARVGRLR
jgi:hypothetical protein